jgi:hypothetical protein
MSGAVRGYGALEEHGLGPARRLGTRGQFPDESPDFFLAYEWDLLEKIDRADSKITFREVVDGLGQLAGLELRTDAGISQST